MSFLKYRGFTVTKSLEIPELQCHLTELIHDESGAEVLHIAADDPENLFCLSFRTLPPSSNGVAHILEHTVLTGSKKFPVRDPFFAMNRRSLNTFMNALTGADFTCYPAASIVEQDFYNLLEVYLDAVFHPLLKELSFAQEGHRLEFTEPTDPNSTLEYKGIVYNEMKGAMAAPTTRLGEAISSALFPDSPYGFNSGGDPEKIPQLSYAELKDFHKKYYHPSQCLFFFYGNLPLEQQLDFLLQHALEGVKKEPPLPPIPKQPRFTQAVRKEVTYPVHLTNEAIQEESEEDVEKSDEESSEAEHTIFLSFCWLTTSILNTMEVLALSVIDSVLMDTDASLLKKELLQSGLCKQASSSLDTENAEVPYVITLKGCKGQDADALETLLRNTLLTICKNGIPKRFIESALHQIELDRLEIGSNGGPFGLLLFGRSALMKQHGGNAEEGLCIHSLFAEFKQTLDSKPHYLENLITTYFLDNPHFVRLTMLPDSTLGEKEIAKERQQIEQLRKLLSPVECMQIVEQAKILHSFQEKTDTPEELNVLPKIALRDVPKKASELVLTKQTVGNIELFHHGAFTNALTYVDLVFPLPEVTKEELWLMRLFTIILPQIGAGNRSYAENLEYIQEHTGGISAGFALNHQVYNCDVITPTLHIRGKSLYRKANYLFRLLFDIATELNCTEKSRIKELIFKHYTNLQSSFTQNAIKYATNLSASSLNVANYINNEWYGLEYFHHIKKLYENFDMRIDDLVSLLRGMQSKLLDIQGAHLVVTCDHEEYAKYVENGFDGLVDLPGKSFKHWSDHFTIPKNGPQARMISSPVAFSAQAFQVGSYSETSSAAICLAANLFENKVLHKRIREQGGAYGGGTGHNPTAGTFYFYSYRDPNISSTIAAFDEAIHSILEGNFDENDLEEAKLEMIQALDAPIAPGTRAEVAYARLREGKTTEVRQAFRDQLLSVNRQQVIQAVGKHIVPKYQTSSFVTFAGRPLIEQENKKLSTPLQMRKI